MLLCSLAAISKAAPLTLVQQPAGTGHYTASVADSFTGTGPAAGDEWSFEAEAGDRVSARLEAVVGASSPRLRLLNASGTAVYSMNGTSDGVATMNAFVLTTPGTYRVQVYSDSAASAYALRFDLGRSVDLEQEPNDTTPAATPVTPFVSSGQFTFSVAGIAHSTDSVGDFFALGQVSPGATLTTLLQLAPGGLTAADVSLQVFESHGSDRSLEFNGATYATIPHNAVFDAIETANAVTLEAWVFVRAWPSTYFSIFDKYRAVGDTGWAFAIENGGGGISFWSGTSLRASSNVTPTVNTWHHVAVAYEHAANSVRFYLDGQLIATRASPGALTNTDTDPAYIGFSPTGSDEYSDGAIGEIRLWNRALSTAEIQANYGVETMPPSSSGLVGLWRFDEGTGLASADSTSNGNHSILGGGNPVRVPAWGNGIIRALPAVSGTSLSRTFPVQSQAWLKFTAASNRGLGAGYFLTGSLTDATNLNLVSTTLAAPGGSTTDLIQSFTLTFDDELDAMSANTLANYELRNAGPDATFNTGDDIVYVLGSPAYLRGLTVTLPLQNGPLQPGKHRLTLGVGLRDRAGNPLPATSATEFTVQQLDRYVIENQSNDTFATATNIGPLMTDGASFAGGGRGNLSSGSDLDFFSFQANAGDRIIVTTESPTHADATGLYYYFYGPAQGNALMTFSAPTNGSDQGQIVAPTTGTYYVRISVSHAYYGEYRFAVAVIPGTMNMESEANDSATNADALTWTMATGSQSASVAGVLNYADPQDWFALGYLDLGTQVSLAATKPPSSSVVWILDILDASSTSVASAPAGAATLLYSVPPGKAGNHYARIRPGSGASLTAQYRLALTLTDTTRPTITGDTLPTEGATVTDFFGNFGLTFSENMQAAGVNDSASFDLRAAGPDGLFNTGDDVLYTVVAATTYATGLNATFRLSDGPLQPGSYRFQAKTTLVDIYGNALAAPYTRSFSIAGVNGYTLESRANDSFATATILPMVPDGTGFLARGRGSISSNTDADYFSFTANAGDRVIITTENPTHSDSTGMYYSVHGPSMGNPLLQFSAPSNGSDQAQLVAAASGTYYVRVSHNYTTTAEYRFAVAVFPEQVGLESETNDTAAGADAVTWVINAGSQTATMAGVVNYGDPGDWFALGFQDVATTLTLSATKPPSSNLSWILDVIDAAGTVAASSAVNAPTLAYTIPASKAGNYFARIRASTGADLLAQYRLTISLGDTSAPTITSSTLPAEGTAVSDFFGDFQLSFSETLRATTVNDAANYDLRAAGADGVFGTGDDVSYTVVLAATYSSGLTASFRVTDGPLQPGSYRFQAKTGLLDLYGNALAAVYTRTFSITSVAGYAFESRSNDTFATATSVSPTGEGSAFGGSWRDGVEYLTSGNAPTSIATADLNNDGKLDLITANNDGGTISVLLGNGDGTFVTPATTYPAPNNPFKVASGDVNGDGRPDVLVTRRNGSSVRVFMNDGAGGFAAPVDIATPTGPVWLVLRDLNGDGSLDFATANYDANSLSVFANNGNGTFGPAATLPVSGSPYSIAAGDLNGDGRIDLAIGTATDRAVKVFYRQVDGSYAAGGVYTWGATDYVSGVAIGDLNGDGRADLLAVTNSTTEVRRWDQQANGTLVEATPLGFGDGVTGYSVMVKDYNGDGLPDVVVGRANNVTVFENLGGGTFASPLNAPTARNAREVVIADFNADGRPDIATTAQQGNAVKIFLGRGVEPLTADGSGFIGRLRGQTSSYGSDVDYFSFSAKAGNRVLITAETPNHADHTGRNYFVFRPDQIEITNFGAESNGTAQTQFIAPVTGTYFIRVQTNWTYNGEYRVTIAVSTETTGGLESELNNTAATADPLTFTPAAGAQSTVMLGVVNYGDAGDWYALGSLAEGTQISLAAGKPPSSGLAWILDILNASGAVVAAGATNATPLTYTVPSGGAGAYYARIRAAAGADMSAQYRLAITLTDTQAPAITSSTLPAEGTSNSTLLDRFSLTFTKDMDPTTVNNVANYDLRLAGADNIFDTADDVALPLILTSTYSSGTTVSLRTANAGALPLGSYRFRALAGLKDKFGNALAPIYTRLFSIVAVAGYTSETEDNGTRATAVALTMAGSQPDLVTGGGRGYLFSTADTDYWSFNLQAGDRAYIIGESLSHADGTGLTYLVSGPTNNTIASLTAPTDGSFTIPMFTAAQAGTYTLKVTYSWVYTGEYRFRVFVLRGSLQAEAEPNDSLATATALTLAPSGNNTTGSMHGVARVAGDLDYVLLGTLQAGTTVFLSTRQPSSSPFVPVVSLYDVNGILVAEGSGGRAGDPVAQVPISVTGVYYVLVRTSGATSALASEYILDVLVVPTAGISFPNLQVTALTPPPATGLKSGDATTVTFRVDNLGNLATGAVTWVDRVVLSTDTVYGNADDVELGVFSHTGPLNAASNYVVNAAPVTIPDGTSGSYYLIARTDHTNTVTEFVLEGDNETVSDLPITIALADYPDLLIENLVVTPPDAGGLRTATWTLANRGTGTAAAGFSERFLVRNTGTGAVPVNTLSPIQAAIAPNSTLPRQATFPAPSAGNYAVEVTADAGAALYEYNNSGHAAAENNNVGSAAFSITQMYTLTVAADPVGGGQVSGGGTFAEGTNVMVTATPTAPYLFVGWFEGSYLRSTNASYSAPLLANRTLTARFGQPTYTITTQVNPTGAGVVNGGGVKTMGAAVSLTASALPGYLFANWSEGPTNLGAVSPLTFTAAADRTLVANFTEANPTHVVTTATSPAAITTVGGAGTYNNGQTATITAPATVTVGSVEYVFERFVLNGAPVGTTASLTKTFSTLDPAAFAYVAEYKSQAVKPTVAAVTTNTGARAGLGANLQISVRFDRAMNQAVKPLVELLSSNSSSIPTVPANGSWTAADTYVVPVIVIGAGNGGDYRVRVSQAQDTQNRTMDPAEVYNVTVDVTAPSLPTLAAGPVTATSAAVTWSGYSPPPDLMSFRVYRSTTSFTSLAGLSPVASLPVAARSHVFTNLAIDTDYFVAVVPVDDVGNAVTTVTPFTVKIASTLPPAVDFTVTPLSSNSARISWTFDATNQIGFAGFKIYRQSASFSSILGLTPIATLAADKTSYDDLNLDRSLTHYYAVVGYNAKGESLTSVVSKPWSDPLSNTLSTDFTAADPVLIISQPLTVTNGATFTVPAGTIVAFGPGASLTIQSGRLIADGTLYAPIVFTSLADVDDTGPTRGSWNGITLSDPSRASSLRNVWVKYGKGLSVTAGTHTLAAFGAVWNDVGGLRLSGSAALTTGSAYLANNAVGASTGGSASLILTGSIIKNNTVNASAGGTGLLDATGAWWGTADAAAIAALVSGPVVTNAPQAGEPILTGGVRAADGATSTGVANLSVRLASMNASSYRLSEDPSFTGVLFVNVPRDPLSPDQFNTSWLVTFPLSAGSGVKTLYAQFRSPTGAISAPVSFTTNYVTAGPVIATFSLTEGQTINRPLTVNATASSALPIASLTFYVDNVIVATSTTTSLSTAWDPRSLPPGTHRVRLVATDTSGNVAAKNLNVVFNPTPPPRPTLTAPANGFKTTATTVTVTGTAEPAATLRVTRNGAVVATTTANAAGAFSAPSVTLVEGSNELAATAYDAIGATSSESVFVSSDTGAPAAVTLLPVTYNANEGVFLDWDLPTSGEVPVLYRVFWSNTSFNSPAQATGQSPQLMTSYTVLKGLPDGVYYFGIVGYDEAGNASALSNLRSYTVDLTPPSFSIAYTQTTPVGPGALGITVTATEPLSATPLLLMKPEGGGLLAVTLTPAGGNNYTVSFPVTPLSARTGTAAIGVSGTDLAGNTFTGPPNGPALVFDVTKPTGSINTTLSSPLQNTSTVTLGVSLVLSEAVKPGTQPTLSFSPPVGSAVPIPLSGSGTSWSGQLTVTPAMDNGMGTFLLSATDAVGNVGTVITSGEQLELYTTPLPPPPAVPMNVTIEPLKGGYIRLKWDAADKAQSYRLYRETGPGAAVPTTLVTANISALTIDDLPPVDGTYRYVVTSFRLGAESGPSGVRATASDRTPPPAPTAATATLGISGVNVTWTPGAGEIPAKWIVYRNDVPIRTITDPSATSFHDAPPRGLMNYAVAAVDTLGNEAKGQTATIELFVGAVANLKATVDPETGTTLTWTSTDATGVGYQVYRNGTKQTASALTALTFSDPLPSVGQPVTYKVTAVNASAQESAARVVVVQPLTAVLRLNPAADGDLRSVARYFDTYTIDITVGAAASAPMTFATGEIIRTVTGETPVQVTFPLPALIGVNETKTATAVLAAPNAVGLVQGTATTLTATAADGGSTVAYRFIKDFDAANPAGLMLQLSSEVPPLAGALSDFTVQVFNNGHAAADIVVSRAGNTQPGDLEMLIVSSAGVLVSTTAMQASAPGVLINAQGDAFLRVEPGASVSIPFNGVLAPESLGQQTVTFRARVKAIYHALGTTLQRTAGPLEGTMESSLRATPYYATATTVQSNYSDNQPVIITGTAIDRATNLPAANVTVRIGIRVRGAVIYQSVQTDANGAFSYAYTPSLGLSGELVIWAAHPDVVDPLNQAKVNFYRIFTNPSRVEAVMTKNDKLDFDVALLNPGDVALGAPAVTFRAYRVENGAEVTVPGLTGTTRGTLPAALGPKAGPKIGLRLQADLTVPNDALFEFTFTTPQGATTKLSGTVSFRPALAVLTVTSPAVGYAEAGLARGQLKSVDVTLMNTGLRALTNVKITPPANIPWMQVNLGAAGDGTIPLEDIPIGGSRSLTIVFSPPADQAVGFYSDYLTISGDNSTGSYRLNLYATVTSAEKGTALFTVSNTFGQPVPNASIWLRNRALGTEIGPVLTDVNGTLQVPDLMEGDWQWKTQAAGHGATQGIVTIMPDQTVSVETELYVVMVTVKFSVVPVPFTDYYEIKIEQTFQTRTPIPNMVLSPPHQSLTVEAGWSGTLLYTLRNEGLRSVFDVKVHDASLPTMRATPLVTFIPELKAQETIQIPVFFEYFGPASDTSAMLTSGAMAHALTDSPGSPRPKGAAIRDPGMTSAAQSAGGVVQNILDCYKEFKYGTLTFKAEGGISSVSGKPYTVGVNATIDVDELLALVCDGDCPARWTGGGVAGKVANALCGKLVSKIVSKIGQKTSVIDTVCKASNIIKAIACAAAQIPESTIQSPPQTGGGSGGDGNIGGDGFYDPGWPLVGSGCFAAGTPVSLPDGSTVPIEQVGQGMKLLASAVGRADAVAQVMVLSSDHVRELTYRCRDIAGSPAKSLRLTHDHRVWVDGRGWTFAADIKTGEWLHGADGRLHEVLANTRLPGRHDVYGLHMDRDNVIYAGGILTEDQCFKAAPRLSVSPQIGGGL